MSGDGELMLTILAGFAQEESKSVSDNCKWRIRNDGRLPQYYVTEAHEPIVSTEMFDEVQTEIARRANNYKQRLASPDGYPLTGMMRCGKCGFSYKRKHAAAGSKYEKIVWICATFNTLGKAECASQQVSEDILMEQIAKVGELDMVEAIIVPDCFRLAFNMKDGSTIETEWQHRSRRDSWTDEMKAATAEKARERNGKNS